MTPRPPIGPRRRATALPRLAGALAVAAGAIVVSGCGSTYVDTSVTVPDTAAGSTTTTLPPIRPDAALDDLLAEIEERMTDLDERIIDQRGDVATLQRIESLWAVAEDQIRDVDPDDVFNFEQAIDLARSGVERRRPADASKGYKILVAVIDAYDPTAG